jgi:DNA-binding beta-propeller fold protein YncE
MSNHGKHALAGFLLALALALGPADSAGANGSRPFEVWTVDQSNTTGKDSGGTLYIYEGDRLNGLWAKRARPERIDLGGAAEALCLAQTGTAPVRPHMLLFNAGHSHAILSYVASGHVLFLDARRRAPLACIDVGVQAHAAVPSPDGTYVVVANQNGKQVHRIATDYRRNSFTLEPDATLDLANGTTPSQALRQDPLLRPDNAPVCPLVDPSSRFTYVTLRGGGLFILDSRATPMRIVSEYDNANVHGNGCGGIAAGNKMYVNSGGGTAANLSEFDVYSSRLNALSTQPSPPNAPPFSLVVSEDHRETSDSHGVALTNGGRYLWVADRSGNRIVTIDTASDRMAGEFPLGTIPWWLCRLSDDPAPDLMDAAPDGDRIFVSLRGRLPLSGDPHASTGSTPGLGVMRVLAGGRTGYLEAILPISNPDAQGIDRADPHALRVRLK